MLRGPDAHAERFLSDMARITERLTRAQRHLSSGRRISTPSDSPSEAAHLVSLRADLSRIKQVQTNLGRIKAETDAAEQALSHAVGTLDRVAVVGTQGATAFVDAGTRRTLAAEVSQLLEQLVGLADTQLDGRYLFSGDSDQTPPYSIDFTQVNPVSAYQGSAATREIMHPSGTRFASGRTARDIFDSPVASESVLQATNALREALAADDLTAVNAALANVRTASRYLNDQLAFYGSIQNQVNEAIDVSGRRELGLLSQIGSVEDADLSAAAIELSSATVQQQTAFQAESRRSRQSLFDYLG
jgi:flagellar hook-associated protein 3 FlgL